MIIYKDIFTGREILTDYYKMELVDDFVYVVEAIYVTKKLEKNDEAMIGGNKSAEEPAEDDVDEPQSISGFDVVLGHNDLEEYGEQPKLEDFLKLLKKIISAAKKRIPDERFENVFKPKMAEFFSSSGPGKTNFSNFKIFFSTGRLNDGGEACPVLLDPDDTGMKAKMYYFKDLLEEVKII